MREAANVTTPAADTASAASGSTTARIRALVEGQLCHGEEHRGRARHDRGDTHGTGRSQEGHSGNAGQDQDGEDVDRPGDVAQRTAAEDGVDRVRLHLRVGHAAAAVKRRSVDIGIPVGGDADHDDLVGELARRDRSVEDIDGGDGGIVPGGPT